MKFKVGDKVLVTAGKDKGKKSTIEAVLADENKVVVTDVNMYVKHVKPFNNQPGQRVRRPRPLPTANVAILNDQDQADRVGYSIAKDGTKQRIFKKTGKVIPVAKADKKDSK
jgi:large subunit ribosomal protein L24